MDNRIGYLQLPELEWDRAEAVLVKLPLDCTEKTLTVAQSTALAFEGGYERVYPCNTTLYCGYAYESSLISESFQTAVPAALSYAAGLALLALFLWQAFQGRLDPGTLCGVLAAFSYLSSRVSETSFVHLYVDLAPIDIVTLCRDLALFALLVMLLCKLSSWRRAALGAVTLGLGALELTNFILAAQKNASIPLSMCFFYLGTAALLLALAFGFGEWNRWRWFFRLFCPMALAGTVLYAIPTMILKNPSSWTLAMLQPPLTLMCMAAAFLSAVAEWGHGDVARRTEDRLLIQRSELARSSYEAMQG